MEGGVGKEKKANLNKHQESEKAKWLPLERRVFFLNLKEKREKGKEVMRGGKKGEKKRERGWWGEEIP